MDRNVIETQSDVNGTSSIFFVLGYVLCSVAASSGEKSLIAPWSKKWFPCGFCCEWVSWIHQRQSSAVKVRDGRCRCVIHVDAKPPPKRQLQSIFHFHFTVSALNWVRKKFPGGANVKLKFWNNSLHRCLIEHIWTGNFTASLTTRFDQVTPSKCSLFVCFSSKLIPALRFAHILYLNSASAAWARSVFPAVVFLWGVSF